MGCLWESLRRMPLVICIITPILFFITYGIALGFDHVSALWPYISDTGTLAPESCVFALILNAITYLMCAVIYVRYLEVSKFMKVRPSVGITKRWNRIAALIGYVTCFGLNLVANFQETNEIVVHLLGALLCFFCGTFYFGLQAIFTRRIYPEARLMLWTRSILTLLNVLFIIGTFAPIKAAFSGFKGKNLLKWEQKDGGFTYHLLSTFSEWLLVLSFLSYVCTFVWDFRKIEIVPPQIKLVDLEDSTKLDSQSPEDGSDTQEDKPDVQKIWI